MTAISTIQRPQSSVFAHRMIRFIRKPWALITKCGCYSSSAWDHAVRVQWVFSKDSKLRFLLCFALERSLTVSGRKTRGDNIGGLNGSNIAKLASKSRIAAQAMVAEKSSWMVGRARSLDGDHGSEEIIISLSNCKE